MKNKICPKCKIVKPLSEFYKSVTGKYGITSSCKLCQKDYYKRNKQHIIKLNKSFPWKRTLKHIKTRCQNYNHHSFKNYGGRGIKCLITEEELKTLWFRDKAYLMKQPSIDRINNDGNYEFNNCRYIEKSDNSIKANKETKSKIVLQYDLNGNFIKEWESLNSIQRALNKNCTNIWSCCVGKSKNYYGSIWKYKT